jgi:O-acetyl-ADP-ribose deacetylase (regulator of RNase III)
LPGDAESATRAENGMKAVIGNKRLLLIRGDITRQDVDAVVTAANEALAGGGGVDGAVHRAAGPRLLEACAALGGCPTGGAVATPAFDLAPVRCVIHAVGPIYGRNEGNDDELLASAHRRSLEEAALAGCTSMAFPAISCGVYGFPIQRAAKIALTTIRDALLGETCVEEVRYVLFSEADAAIFKVALEELVPHIGSSSPPC